MNVEFLLDYLAPVTFGICLCVGYIVKHVIPNKEINKYIPLIVGGLGIIINAWVNFAFTPTILLAGMFSGLASTGFHQLFKKLIKDDE